MRRLRSSRGAVAALAHDVEKRLATLGGIDEIFNRRSK